MARKNRRIRDEYEPAQWTMRELMTALPELPAVEPYPAEEMADAA